MFEMILGRKTITTSPNSGHTATLPGEGNLNQVPLFPTPLSEMLVHVSKSRKL